MERRKADLEWHRQQRERWPKEAIVFKPIEELYVPRPFDDETKAGMVRYLKEVVENMKRVGQTDDAIDKRVKLYADSWGIKFTREDQ